MRVVILVPRRNDNGHRDLLWAYCRARWESWDDPLPIYEGHHDIGPFNRSAAINAAAAEADLDGHWDVALVIDSDTVSNQKSVWEAINLAERSGGLVVAHDRRLMLSERATSQIMNGYAGNWERNGMVKKIWRDSVSCAVAIKRETWDLIGGFDDRFEGWGFEDTAFHIACETITGLPIATVAGDCFHLWHPVGPDTSRNSPTYKKNHALKRRYEALRWQPERLLRLLGRIDEEVPVGTIPRILHRTVPEQTTAQVEGWWQRFAELHPDWELRTYREPIDPKDWPMTGQLFDQCQNGAQKAGLIRLEAIYTYGGVYVDSDVIPHRPFDSLLQLSAFAAWEDEKVVPDAVLGGAAGHPAFMQLIGRAREAIEDGQDAWHSGPGGTTEILPGRSDVLVLPPGAFYPAHYLEKAKLGKSASNPWVFCEHQWHHSWGSEQQKANIEKAQRNHPRVRPTRKPTIRMATADEVVVDKDVVVCIPWNDTEDLFRLAAFEWCKRYWLHAGANVVMGGGESRSAMRNHAGRLAIEQGADVLFFADADTWVPIAQLNQAVQRARETGQIVHAYDTYTRLTAGVTQRAMQTESPVASVLATNGVKQRGHMSGAFAIPVALWEQIGGYDERFVKWGFEDRCFEMAAGVFGGGIQRVSGPAIHWFHRPAEGKQTQWKMTDPAIQLALRYCQASAKIPARGKLAIYAQKVVIRGSDPDPDAMRALLSENGGPLGDLVTAIPPWGPPVLEK